MSTEPRKYVKKIRAERQQETRSRIIDATLALHRELGPARTTVAEIARRAGVRRMTVYDHFPDDADLFAACQSRFLAEHPPPDFGSALALDSPRARVGAVLGGLYRSYRTRAPVTEKILRDRRLVPALDALMERTLDANLARLADALADCFDAAGPRRRRLRALLALALDFFTWQRLVGEGLSDDVAAALMADVIVGVGTDPGAP